MEQELKDKLSKIISLFNNETEDNKGVNEKRVLFIRKIIESHKSKDDKEIKDLLILILNLDFRFFTWYGDEILESIWGLYSQEILNSNELFSFNTEKSPLSKESLFSLLLRQFFQSDKIDSYYSKNIFEVSTKEYIADTSKLIDMNDLPETKPSSVQTISFNQKKIYFYFFTQKMKDCQEMK